MSYKQVKTYSSVRLESGSSALPVASLEDPYGGKAHIIKDDHCYMLILNTGKSGLYRKTPWIFKEAHEVMRKLPPL